MPVTPTYPGVYIEEIPSGVRTITGVSTSVTAFIGYTARGAVDQARQIFNFGDFERNFGGLNADSPVSYAVQQFFQNGGSEAWIVRIANGATRAGITLLNSNGGTAVLDVTAISEGAWGNNLRLDVDYDAANPASLFNLAVTEFVEVNGALQVARTELHRNLSMNSFAPGYAIDTVNAASEMIRLTRSGTALAVIAAVRGESVSGTLSLADFALLSDDARRLAITINGDGPYEFDIFDAGGSITGGTLNALIDNLALAIAPRIAAIQPTNAASRGPQRRAWAAPCASAPARRENAPPSASAAPASATPPPFCASASPPAVRETDAVSQIRPAQTGTVGTDIGTLILGGLAAPAAVNVSSTIGATTIGPFTVDVWDATGRPTSLAELSSRLADALRNTNTTTRQEIRNAVVTLVDNRLRVAAGGSDPNALLTFADASLADTTATSIGLAGGTANVARYAPGAGATVAAQSTPIQGGDGSAALTPLNYIGSRPAKTGLYALENVDIFNLLCLPGVSDRAANEMATILTATLAYVNERRAFLIVDTPATVDSLDDARTWINDPANLYLRDKNCAAYFPHIMAPDPLQNFRQRAFPPCGAVAGIFARTDTERGVWKAPAGTESIVKGAQGLAVKLTDPENGVLNPLGLNSLRVFPVYGTLVWGARTMVGADQLASEWKYVPIRRLALYLEESLYRGSKWIVFMPNDEPLWAQIRLNFGAFMHNLFRQGAFQGRTPSEAYFVKCDKETTTQNDIDLGRVNIVVGFAPLKPAEFVIIQIQQIAGQLQT